MLLKPFMLFLTITTYNQYSVNHTTDTIYTPSEAACSDTLKQLVKANTWILRATSTNKVTVRSKARGSCVPMRGVQHMPNRHRS